MKKLIVGCSPITSEIFVGKLNNEGNKWIGEKENVTDSAVNSVAQHLLQKDEKVIFSFKDKKYALQVVEVNQ